MMNAKDKVVFHVNLREKLGTSQSKQLRHQGKVVGNVFGLGKDSTAVYMDKMSIKRLYEDQGDTSLIYLTVGDSKKQSPALIDSYDIDPVTQEPTHVSFRRVDLSDPIEADIAVSLIGEADVPGAVISLVKDSVTVEALPADLPEGFEIDISALSEIGQSVMLSDLEFDSSKVTLVLGEDETPEEITMVIVQEVKEEVEEEPSEEVSEEGVEAPASEESSDGKQAEESANSDEKSEVSE